jgi:disulfide bond formation protein DsbB
MYLSELSSWAPLMVVLLLVGGIGYIAFFVALKSPKERVALLVAFGIVEYPLWASIYQASTCQSVGCGSVIEAGIFWQPLALLILGRVDKVPDPQPD